MPAKYDRTRALPLQVPPTLRAELDALVASAPAALRLNRTMVAVEALRRGLAVLRVDLARDPLAVHRGLVSETTEPAATVTPSTTSAPTVATTKAPTTRPSKSTRAPRAAPAPARAAEVDSAAVLARFLASEVKVATFARAHGIPRSTLQMWATGERSLNAKALARVVKGLDAEGK